MEDVLLRIPGNENNREALRELLAKCYSPDATEEERKWYRNKANKFRGLTKEGSYVPPKPELVKDGRSNPKFIRYLYIS